MTFKIFISSAIVSAVISVIGGIITTVITQRSARNIAQDAANQEIKKLERTWEREDLVSSDDEFATMAAAVAGYIGNCIEPNRNDSLRLVASVRSKESGNIGMILDDLYQYIKARDAKAADQTLTMAIDEKRRLKSI